MKDRYKDGGGGYVGVGVDIIVVVAMNNNKKNHNNLSQCLMIVLQCSINTIYDFLEAGLTLQDFGPKFRTLTKLVSCLWLQRH